MVRFSPKAKLSSLPLNHLARAVVTATHRDSAPSPSTVLPATMTAKWPTSPVRMEPRRQRNEKIQMAFLAPMRSTIMPPMSRVTTAATL